MTINVEFDDNGVITVNKSGIEGSKYIRRVYQDDFSKVVAEMDITVAIQVKEKLDELSTALEIRMKEEAVAATGKY